MVVLTFFLSFCFQQICDAAEDGDLWRIQLLNPSIEQLNNTRGGEVRSPSIMHYSSLFFLLFVFIYIQRRAPALWHASWEGHLDVVEWLLINKKGVDINATDKVSSIVSVLLESDISI